MGYWGWRSLALLMCLSVWVVSCTDKHDQTPPDDTPAQTAQQTRFARSTPYIPPDDDPLLEAIITPEDTREPVAIAATLIGRAATPQVPLALQPTTCYELASGGIRCLLQVTNTQSIPVTDIRVLTQLYDRYGRILREQVSTALQWAVPAGEMATVQTVFPPEDMLYLGEQFGAARTTLISSRPLTEPARYVPLTATVDQLQTAIDADGIQVKLTVTVENNSTITPDSARVHITLTDTADRVAAYRVLDLDDLPDPDRPITLTTLIIPRSIQAPLTATVYAEGRVD